MTHRVDFRDWQRVRASITATQTRILADRLLIGKVSPPERDGHAQDKGVCVPEHRPADACHHAGLRAERPAEGRPLHSHKPRSDEEWEAIQDGIRALLAELESTSRWRWVGSRRVVVR